MLVANMERGVEMEEKTFSNYQLKIAWLITSRLRLLMSLKPLTVTYCVTNMVLSSLP